MTVLPFLLGLASPAHADGTALFTLDLTFLVDLPAADLLALREEARIAAQDDTLLGQVFVFCGDPTLPVGCWAQTEYLGDIIADQADISRAGELQLQFPISRRVGIINIAHGTPDPL